VLETTTFRLADGVDDETWLFHLRHGDYSQWLRDGIKDTTLADEIAAVERREPADAKQSRHDIRAAIERIYTLPAAPVLPIPGTAAASGRV